MFLVLHLRSSECESTQARKKMEERKKEKMEARKKMDGSKADAF